MSSKRTGLGTNLSALLGNSGIESLNSSVDTNSSEDASQRVTELDINLLQKGKYQPRKEILPESLTDLAESIKSQGIIQPIIVRQINSSQYEILAGERRWQAAKLANLGKVPCILKDVSDKDAMLISIIENIQREDLNSMEEAEGLAQIKANLNTTDEELAKVLGKSRSSISNTLRLNGLGDKSKELLRRGELEVGHAKVLLGVSDQELQGKVALQVVQKGLTVRETERLVKSLITPTKKKEAIQDPEFDNFKEAVTNCFQGMNVKCINSGKNKGKLILSYKNSEELQRIKTLFGV